VCSITGEESYFLSFSLFLPYPLQNMKHPHQFNLIAHLSFFSIFSFAQRYIELGGRSEWEDKEKRRERRAIFSVAHI